MDMWQVVNHNLFHGRLDDVFTGTSLHLKVTGWSRELDFGGGKCVPDGTYLEAIVSAYDTGVWLGDLTYPHIGRPVLRIVSALEGCRGATPVIGTMPPEDLVVVENWEELLSPHPTQPAVVMCHGNWQARVTAISLSLTKGYRTVIFNGHGCWQCAFGLLGKLKRDEAKEVLKSSSKRRTKSNSDASSSDEDASSSDSEEEKDSNESGSLPKTTGEGRLAEGEGRKEQEGGDDATLIDQGEASNNLAEDLERTKIDGATDDSDSDSETSSSESSSILEDDDRLEEILRTLPYKPTVFIL
ncbi:hypothetical protein PG993_011634 [Apiospora rasikravindrae]|uniref:Rhodanese domain-containing protein n=1 Tax=Apiospora rasikravindrae TaxID=990691 RepID=A0ABR1S0A0_9PEZI